ncbi:MAG: hypothetical protein WDN00_04790 [Limisphaerales bacterium]
MDRDNLGRFNAANNNQIVQTLDSAIGANFGTPPGVLESTALFHRPER